MADEDDALTPREKELREKYLKGKKSWKKKVVERIAHQFLGRYSEDRDPTDASGEASDGEKGEAPSV